MRILHVISGIEIESGGVATAVCGMAEAVAARGHQVTIACLDRGNTPPQPPSVALRTFPPDHQSPLWPSRGLRDYLGENVPAFEVVHIHGLWQQPGHYAAAAARLADIPYVVAPHGMLDASSLAMGRRWAKSVAWFLWDSTTVNGAAAIHCLNEAEIRSSPALRTTPNVVIGNGIPSAVLENLPSRGLWRQEMKNALGDASRPIALSLGRLHPVKGLERLLLAWPAALRQYPDALLVIAGTGDPEYVGRVKSLVRQTGLENAVLFAGQLSGADKWQALVDADVFVHPSYREGFSLAVTEAMAAGLPVILTRECNFDEVERKNAGVIIDRGDMAAFVIAATTLIGSAESRRSMGRNGQSLVRERFTWEAAARKLEQLYHTLASRTELPDDLRPAETSNR